MSSSHHPSVSSSCPSPSPSARTAAGRSALVFNAKRSAFLARFAAQQTASSTLGGASSCGAWHSAERSHGNFEAVQRSLHPAGATEPHVSAARLFMQVMGFKHGRDWEAWAALKADVESRREAVERAQADEERKAEEKRLKDNRDAYDRWMLARGRRVVLAGKEWSKEVDGSGAEKDAGERRRMMRKERPWRDAATLSEEQRAAREVAKLKKIEREKEEEEAKKALAEGVFLEWLAAKNVQEKQRKEEARALRAKEEEAAEREKDLKWRKKVVVCCYESDAAKSIAGERLERGLWNAGAGGERQENERPRDELSAAASHTLSAKERKAVGGQLFAEWKEGRGGRKIVLQDWVKTQD